MSDYNDGLLPEPCLRMDTHFGDEYESVEFGDGTGYVKAEPTLARLGALHVELDELRDKNAKLRKLAAEMYPCAKAYLQEWRMVGGIDSKSYDWYLRLRELGVETSE